MAETLTVTVDDGGTYTVTVGGVALFSDAGLTTPVTFPTTVAADTTWYAAAHRGQRQVGIKVVASDGTVMVDEGGITSLPFTVNATEGGQGSASAPASPGGSSSLTEGIHLRAVANPYTLTGGLVFLVAADFTIIKQVGSDLTLGASTHGDGAAVISAAGGMFEQSMYVEAQLTADGSSSVPRILQAGAASFSDSGFFGLGIDGTLPLINGVDCWTTVAGLPSDVPAGGEAASSPQLALDNPIGTDSVAVYLDWFVWKR